MQQHEGRAIGGGDARDVDAPTSAAGYGLAWLRACLERASGLVFDDAQAGEVAALAERKLVDLFDVARRRPSPTAAR
jgi:hypothetical protein